MEMAFAETVMVANRIVGRARPHRARQDSFHAAVRRGRPTAHVDPIELARGGVRHRSAVPRQGDPVQPQIARTPPLNVHVVLADAGLDVAPFLAALRSHLTLVCPSPTQAVESARRFDADVVLIDSRVPALMSLMRDLTAAAGGRTPVFVTMCPTAGLTPNRPDFSFCLPLPAAVCELEQLLRQIQRGLAARSPDPANRPDTETIG
jgi:hypothetical protein